MAFVLMCSSVQLGIDMVVDSQLTLFFPLSPFRSPFSDRQLMRGSQTTLLVWDFLNFRWSDDLRPGGLRVWANLPRQ